MAVGVKCPYCGRVGYTSSPRTNHACPYCKRGHDYTRTRGEKSRIKEEAVIPAPEKKGEKNERSCL